MILNHLWGLYAHPKEEWHTIDARHESFRYSLIHILLVALIPSLCAYYSAVHIGWSIGVGEPIRLTAESAMMLSVAMYVANRWGLCVSLPCALDGSYFWF